ncbi:MAG: hypothetical protein HY075_00680 [Deltaproteobacteria bacterium]|nr:hypothetical protein [Deltaproteobacteria bacterium]
MKGIVFFGMLLAAAPLANAIEGGVGNGGTAVVCRDRAGKIESAELLDLYEAHNFGNTVEIDRGQSGAKKDLLARALGRLSFDNVLQADVWAYDEEIEARQRDVKSSWLYKPGAIREELPKLDRPGCGFEVVINYLGDYDVRVNRPVYDALPALDQAALAAHEAIFRLARERAHVHSSRAVRPLVAQLFAKHFDGALAASIARAKLGEKVTTVTLYSDADAHLRLFFDVHSGAGGLPEHFVAYADCGVYLYQPGAEQRTQAGKWHFNTQNGIYLSWWDLTLSHAAPTQLDGRTLALECARSGDVGVDATFVQNKIRVARVPRAIDNWTFDPSPKAKFRISVVPGQPPKGRSGN